MCHTTSSHMNTRTFRKEKRSVSAQVIRPLARAFGLNESFRMNSDYDNETGARRRSPTSMVRINIPRKLKQSLTTADDNDSVFKFGSSSKLRGKKKSEPKKDASTKTFQTSSTSSSSAHGTCACYRLPSPRQLSKKLLTKKWRPTKECRDDFVISESSSSCSSGFSINEGSSESSFDSVSEMRDNYLADDFGSNPTTQAFYLVQDCYEEHDALILQLHIPSEHHTQPSERLDVEYLPFKIPVIRTGKT